MLRLMILGVLTFGLCITYGCGGSDEDAGDQPTTAPDVSDDDEQVAPGEQDMDDDQSGGGFQPTYDVTLEVMESQPPQYAAAWGVRVNTGGWRLIQDEVTREEGLVKVYVTLEKPGPDEIVTQAFETLEGRFDSGIEVIERIELYVNSTVRGGEQREPQYTLVATAP